MPHPVEPRIRYNAGDMDPTPHERHLQRLRHWRNPARRDLTLGHLPNYVHNNITKPHRQLGQLVDLWREHVPEHIEPHTALAGFSRGVLTVHVADSATLYELDRLLRGGLERRIQRAAQTTVRRIRLRQAPPQGSSGSSRA